MPWCPFGPSLLVPMFFISAATMCTFYAGFECTFFQTKGVLHHELTITYGLWTVEDYKDFRTQSQQVSIQDKEIGTANSCSKWSNHAELTMEDIDGPLQIGRISILIACVLGAYLTIWIFFAWCCAYRRCSRRLAVFWSLLAMATTAFSFYAWKSKYCAGYECELGFAGIIGIVAAVLWIFAACSIGVMRDYVPPVSDDEKKKKKKKLFRRKKKADQETGYEEQAPPVVEDSESPYKEDDGDDNNNERDGLYREDDNGYADEEQPFHDQSPADDNDDDPQLHRDTEEDDEIRQYQDDEHDTDYHDDRPDSPVIDTTTDEDTNMEDYESRRASDDDEDNDETTRGDRSSGTFT